MEGTNLLDVVAGLSTGFYEHDVQLLRFSLSIFGRNLPVGKHFIVTNHKLKGGNLEMVITAPLIGQIGFVADEHDDDVAASFRSDVVDPF